MQKKSLLAPFVAAFLVFLLTSGIAYAASVDATSKLGGGSGDSFIFDGTGEFGSIKVGKQGVGGVTFFNGTIVNATTNDGKDNPVTFGDNVRIDGAIQRGTNSTGDNLNVKINDSVDVTGGVNVTGNGIFGSLQAAGRDILGELDLRYSKTEVDSLLASKVNTSSVYTKTQSDGRYIQLGKSESKVYAASHFRPVSDSIEYIISQSSTRVLGNTNTGTTPNRYFVPIDLPEGSTLNNLSLKVSDSDATYNVSGSLEVVDALGVVTGSPTLATSGSPGLTTLSTASSLVIDNTNSYYFYVDLTNDSSFIYSLQVDYTTAASN